MKFRKLNAKKRWLEMCRTNHSQNSFKIGVLKNFAIFTGKHLCWSLFLIKVQTFRPATLLKRGCNTDVFLGILRNFSKQPFYRTPPIPASKCAHCVHGTDCFALTQFIASNILKAVFFAKIKAVEKNTSVKYY